MNIYLPVCSYDKSVTFLPPPRSNCQLPSWKNCSLISSKHFSTLPFLKDLTISLFSTVFLLLFLSSDFVLSFLPSSFSNYRRKTSVFTNIVFLLLPWRHLNWENIEAIIFFAIRKEENMIFSSLSIHRSPWRLHTHPLNWNRLDGLSLSLKSLFKFIVDSYLAMKLNTWERKLAKIASQMELRVTSWYNLKILSLLT